MNSLPIDDRSLDKGGTTISILLIGLMFFIFGFVSWVNSILIPYFKIACELTSFQAYLVAVGMVYTQNGNVRLGPYGGYEPLLKAIIAYFETGKVPVSPEETTEIFAFMEAADESKRRGGTPVSLASVMASLKP